MGHDFSQIRIHNDTRANQTADGLRAHAFTVGSDIAFAAGQYQPGTASGRHLQAHELTHTIQQTGGVAAKRVQRKEAERGPAADEGVCPVCGTIGKGTCPGCGSPFLPVQRKARSDQPDDESETKTEATPEQPADSLAEATPEQREPAATAGGATPEQAGAEAAQQSAADGPAKALDLQGFVDVGTGKLYVPPELAGGNWGNHNYGDPSVVPCFVPGTLVTTPVGDRAIETLRQGDLIFAYDMDRRQVVQSPVLQIYLSQTQHLVDIQVNGEIIQATRQHPLLGRKSGRLDRGNPADSVPDKHMVQPRRGDDQIRIRHQWVEWVNCIARPGLKKTSNTTTLRRSLAVLLLDQGGRDVLYDWLVTYRRPGRPVCPDLLHPRPYAPLRQMLDASGPQRSALAQQFLVQYYTGMTGLSWHDLHLRTMPAFFGYWCFELAALVVCAEVRDAAFANNLFYPRDLTGQRLFRTREDSAEGATDRLSYQRYREEFGPG